MRIAGILGFAAALAAGPLAAEGRLDTGFGTQGLVVEGFQPAAAGGVAADTDIALAGCSGPQAIYASKLIGTAGGARVDPSFGTAGYTPVRPDAVAPPCGLARVFATNDDYAVLRPEAPLSGDGFEERRAVR